MNIKRLPIAFLVAGLVLKTLVLVGWKLWKFPRTYCTTLRKTIMKQAI
jgi:predicted negative regulator of RcsB-dependent stress response